MVLLVGTTVYRLCSNTFLSLVLASILFCACQNKAATVKEPEKLPFYNSAAFDAEWIPVNDSNYNKIHTIANFSFQNQMGDTITNKTLYGSIYLANFFFTSCSGICPKMANNFRSLQDSFANTRAVKLISFSVMPWVDSVQRLHDYAIANKINGNKWFLLTGNKDEIYHLARNSFFAEKSLGLQKSNDEFLHTESMLLIDKKARIRGIYNATSKVDMERVIEDVRVLLNEKE